MVFFHFQLSYADVAFICSLKWCDADKVDPKIDNFPKLKALRDKVEAIPEIAEINEKHKDCLF